MNNSIIKSILISFCLFNLLKVPYIYALTKIPTPIEDGIPVKDSNHKGVFIKLSDDTGSCSGTRIGNYVITAEHCVCDDKKIIEKYSSSKKVNIVYDNTSSFNLGNAAVKTSASFNKNKTNACDQGDNLDYKSTDLAVIKIDRSLPSSFEKKEFPQINCSNAYGKKVGIFGAGNTGEHEDSEDRDISSKTLRLGVMELTEINDYGYGYDRDTNSMCSLANTPIINPSVEFLDKVTHSMKSLAQSGDSGGGYFVLPDNPIKPKMSKENEYEINNDFSKYKLVGVTQGTYTPYWNKHEVITSFNNQSNRKFLCALKKGKLFEKGSSALDDISQSIHKNCCPIASLLECTSNKKTVTSKNVSETFTCINKGDVPIIIQSISASSCNVITPKAPIIPQDSVQIKANCHRSPNAFLSRTINMSISTMGVSEFHTSMSVTSN